MFGVKGITMPNTVIGAKIGAAACGVIGFSAEGELGSISKLEGISGGAAVGDVIGIS